MSDEVKYYLNQMAMSSEEWQNEEAALVNLESLLEFSKIEELQVSLRELRYIHKFPDKKNSIRTFCLS